MRRNMQVVSILLAVTLFISSVCPALASETAGEEATAQSLDNVSDETLAEGEKSEENDSSVGVSMAEEIETDEKAAPTEDTVKAASGVAFAGGSGTEKDPYKVSTAAQLDAVRNYPEAYFIQTADINLSTVDNWVPIGKDSDHCFWGSYDGNGHTISNLKIKNDGTEDYVGLFGYSGSAIKNLSLENVKIEIDMNLCGDSVSIGTLAGNAPIVNCSSAGTINVTGLAKDSDIGGLAGCAQGIEYSHSSVIISINCSGSQEMSIGGLAGRCLHSSASNSYFKGSISSSDSLMYVGGIAGQTDWSDGVINCVNYGNINTQNERAGSTIAGIVGIVNEVDDSQVVEDCVNFGNISGSREPFVTGITRADGITVHNCYDLGNVEGNTSSGRIFTSDARNVNSSGNYAYEGATVNSIIPDGGLLPSGFNGMNMSAEDIRINISDILDECECEWVDPSSIHYIDPDDEEVSIEVYQAFEEHAESRVEIGAAYKWSFPNWENYFPDSQNGYYISRRDFERLIKGLSFTDRKAIVGEIRTNGNGGSYLDDSCWTEKLNVDRLGTPYTDNTMQNGNTRKWGGSCAGMSTLAMLINNGVISANEIEQGADSVSSISNSSHTASAINFYHFQQYGNYEISKVHEFYQLGVSGGQKAQLEMCKRLARDAMDNGKVFEIGYSWKEYDNNQGKWIKHGHAVLVYGLDESIGSISFNGKIYTKRILIYDCSNPYNNIDTTDLYFNDSGEFCIPGHGIFSTTINSNDNSSDNGKIDLVTADTDVINAVDYVTGKHQIYSVENEIEYIVTRFKDIYDSITIKDEDTEEVWKVIPAGSSSDNSDIKLTVFNNSDVHKTGAEADEYTIVLPERTHSYSVVYDDNDLNCTISRGKYLVEVKASSPGQVMMNDNGEVHVNTESKGELSTTLVADDPFESTNMNLVTITSSEISSFDSELTDNGIIVSTDTDNEVTVFGCNDEENFTETIDNDQDNIIINDGNSHNYNEIASGTCGDNATWTLTDAGTLSINGSGSMEDFPSITAVPWYGYKSQVTKVVVSNGITSIGDYAFFELPMTRVSLPSGIKTIGQAAFNGCSELRSFVIPAGTTLIKQNAFGGGMKGKSKMEVIEVDEGNKAFKSVDGVLFSKDGKSLVAYPAGRSGEFSIPEGTESIAPYAFCGCMKLDSIIFTEGNSGSALKSIGEGAFNTTGIKEIVIPESVNEIGERAFGMCDQLVTASLDAPITELSDYLFMGCTELSSVALPESLQKIYRDSFWECKNLKDVYYGGSETQWENVELNGGLPSSAVVHFAKKEIIPTITLSKTSFFYNGKVQKPTVTVKDGNTVLTTDDYTVSWPSGCVDVGTYNVTVTLKGNYSGTGSASFEIISPWQKNDGVTYYYDENGDKVTGWQTIDGEKYYFDDDGAMHIGWLQLGDKWYYFRVTGVMHTGMLKKDGKYYYLEKSGVRHSGWLQVNSKLYYFKLNGEMLTGWLQVKGKKFYFKTNGEMLTGWLQVKGKKFYFKTNGQMHTGWLKLSGKYYYFKETGQMVTGRYKIGNKWFIFDKNGVRQ